MVEGLRPSRRRSTSAKIAQSGREPANGGGNARGRLMQRSEFVTVPSFSPPALAGNTTCANRAVSVAALIPLTTLNAQPLMAAATRSAFGIDTAGLVWMIQIVVIRPSACALNMSTALSLGACAIIRPPPPTRRAGADQPNRRSLCGFCRRDALIQDRVTPC
jgi:hypothetical protein